MMDIVLRGARYSDEAAPLKAGLREPRLREPGSKSATEPIIGTPEKSS